MSVIRKYNEFVINLTKVFKISKDCSLFHEKPYIKFITSNKSDYNNEGYTRDNLQCGGKIMFDSKKERDIEYNKIIKILENYYKNKKL
jgi:hypothetical protein